MGVCEDTPAHSLGEPGFTESFFHDLVEPGCGVDQGIFSCYQVSVGVQHMSF